MTNNNNNNIFLTSENFALALPLITLCTVYAYFKFIPLKYGLPLLGGLAGLIHLRSKMKIKQAEKNMQDVVDESIMDDLQGEDAANWMTTSKRQKQAEEKLRQRIKAEQKAENVRKSSGKGIEVDEDDDDDDTAMLTFAKGGRDTKTKKK